MNESAFKSEKFLKALRIRHERENFLSRSSRRRAFKSRHAFSKVVFFHHLWVLAISQMKQAAPSLATRATVHMQYAYLSPSEGLPSPLRLVYSENGKRVYCRNGMVPVTVPKPFCAAVSKL